MWKMKSKDQTKINVSYGNYVKIKESKKEKKNMIYI